MKNYRKTTGPFVERPYYTQDEIEQICTGELRKVDLYPKVPSPVRIERFIEKRFGISPRYEDVPEGVLGYTRFGREGVQEIVISTDLVEDGARVSERRMNATLAHEAGHGLLHAHLFALESITEPLFGEVQDNNWIKVLCRADSIVETSLHKNSYDGRWWEFQANRAIGALLLPKLLVEQCLGQFLVSRGLLGRPTLPEESREKASRNLAATFEVNPVVARIRIGELYPVGGEQQLTL
jgi:hypothetical protein